MELEDIEISLCHEFVFSENSYLKKNKAESGCSASLALRARQGLNGSTRKVQWSYIGTVESVDYSLITQNCLLQKDSNQTLNKERSSRGSLAWFGRQTHNLESVKGAIVRPEVAGSNPAPGTKN